MTSTISQDNEVTGHKKSGSGSQLAIEMDALTEVNSEIFVLKKNERRKSKQLEKELESGNAPENFKKKCISSDNAVARNDKTSEDFLQNILSTLKEKLQSKEDECEDLQDKLSVMNQELSSQGEQLARVTSEFEHQVKHLRGMLAQERNFNRLLSEESDQTVHELLTRIHEKDDLNRKLKAIQEDVSERMQTIENECLFYQTKLHDTEKRLSTIANAKERQVVIATKSVSCQVSESELHARGLHESEAFYEVFLAMWENGKFGMDGLKSSKKYKMKIFELIRSGFSELRENVFA